MGINILYIHIRVLCVVCMSFVKPCRWASKPRKISASHVNASFGRWYSPSRWPAENWRSLVGFFQPSKHQRFGFLWIEDCKSLAACFCEVACFWGYVFFFNPQRFDGSPVACIHFVLKITPRTKLHDQRRESRSTLNEVIAKDLHNERMRIHQHVISDLPFSGHSCLSVGMVFLHCVPLSGPGIHGPPNGTKHALAKNGFMGNIIPPYREGTVHPILDLMTITIDGHQMIQTGVLFSLPQELLDHVMIPQPGPPKKTEEQKNKKANHPKKIM